jgi:hypothetical protein
VLLMLISSTVRAADFWSYIGGAIIAGDWLQTLKISDQKTPASTTIVQASPGNYEIYTQPEQYRYSEQWNSFLPSHPTRKQVNTYFAVYSLLYAGLLQTKFKRYAITYVVTINGAAVLHNYFQLGISVSL